MSQIESSLGEACRRVVAAANDAANDAAGLFATISRNAALARTVAAKNKEAQVRAAATEAAASLASAQQRAQFIIDALAPGALSGAWSAAPSWLTPTILAAADHVRLGTVNLASRGLPPFRAPLLVPWLNHGNLVIEAGAAEMTTLATLIQGILLRSLLGTGAGQLTLASFDPGLTSTLAAFSALRAAREDVVLPSVSEPSDLRELLDDLTHDVRRITDMYSGETSTLGGFRTATGQPIESYQVVTVLGYPTSFDPDLNQRLTTLMRTGPACGISFLVHHDLDAQVPDRLDPSRVLSAGRRVRIRQRAIDGIDGFDLRFDQPPAYESVRTMLDSLATRIRSAAAPRIDFASLQPEEGAYWTHSSADRIVATIGRTGHRPIDIVLGDEADQKHNVLVTGAVGQGKSNLLMVLIHSWAMRYSPDELVMYLLDFKDGVTLYPLARHGVDTSWLPHAKVLGVESDRPYGLAVLEHLVEEFERRSTIIKPFGDNISRYRQQRPDATMPRIAVVIDEFHVLLDQDDETTSRAITALDRLSRKGRAYGIHLVLASQTLSGITQLMSKKDGIFAQFPIRLALYNSALESRTVLSQNNAEAARLRYRGELVVNRDFGEVESNSRGVVAYADPAELVELRHRLVGLDGAQHVPSTFDGGRPARYPDDVPRVSLGEPMALLGIAIDVDAEPVWAPFRRDPGRHLALLGTGRRPKGTLDVTAPVEALRTAAATLGATSGPGASFWLLDVLPDDDPDRSAIVALATDLVASGQVVRRIKKNEARMALGELKHEVEARHEGLATGDLFVVIFGVDRIPQIAVGDFITGNGEMPLDGIHAAWREGGQVGVHVLGWWGTPRFFRDHTVNYGMDGLVDVIMMFTVGKDAVTDTFGPFATWESPNLRTFVRDVLSNPNPAVLVPVIMPRTALEPVDA